MRIKGVLLLSGLLLLGGMLLASDYDKRTVITFNEPVMIAGVPLVTLEPGQYVIKLVNHDHNRNIVQVFNERENKLFTTVLAIPNYRLFPKDKTTFDFWETPRGNPIALRAWFAPGDNWGQPPLAMEIDYAPYKKDIMDAADAGRGCAACRVRCDRF